jgi:excisionase family DNA binding protein
MSTQIPTRDDTVLLSPAEVARRAAVSRATVYRAVQRGVLPAKHAGRQLRIDPYDYRRWLDRGTEGEG